MKFLLTPRALGSFLEENSASDIAEAALDAVHAARAAGQRYPVLEVRADRRGYSLSFSLSQNESEAKAWRIANFEVSLARNNVARGLAAVFSPTWGTPKRLYVVWVVVSWYGRHSAVTDVREEVVVDFANFAKPPGDPVEVACSLARKAWEESQRLLAE